MIEGSGFRAGSEPLTNGSGSGRFKKYIYNTDRFYIRITIFLSKVKAGKLIDG
jgi:hypothetical protein